MTSARAEPTKNPRFEARCEALRAKPETWLVTGAAGFIGSNLCELLLGLDQRVVGLDNLANGFERNIESVRAAVGPERAARFEFIRGDVRDLDDCRRAMKGARYVLHQGALGSVPRSLARPIDSHEANVTGTLNVLVAAKELGPERVVFASSSSVYGDSPTLPKRESETGRPLSPYAATKLFGEVYAEVFARSYGLQAVGLRYFNVFGKRQRPDGPYAAVIPRWIGRLLDGEPVEIYGDGETSRDFSYVANVAQANLMAATEAKASASGQSFNVAYGATTSLNRLFEIVRDGLAARTGSARLAAARPSYKDFRSGDIRDSLADVARARDAFGYAPTHALEAGMAEALDWYVTEHERAQREGPA